MPSLRSLFDANAGLSVCTKHPEHISNEQRDFATMSRPKLTLLSRAEMACLHSTVMPSVRSVVRPSQLMSGVCSSISGARTNAKAVWDEPEQRLDCRDFPSDGSPAAPLCGATVKDAGRGVSQGHQASTPRPTWVMSLASGSGTWRSVAFWEPNPNPDEANYRQEGVLWALF